MYKYVLNFVVKISVMFAKYFEYYTIILSGPFFHGHAANVDCIADAICHSSAKCSAS